MIGVRPNVRKVKVEVDAISLFGETLCLTECVCKIILIGVFPGRVDPYSMAVISDRLVCGNLRFLRYLSLTPFMPPSPRMSSAGLVSL